jgi:hypothetical protein
MLKTLHSTYSAVAGRRFMIAIAAFCAVGGGAHAENAALVEEIGEPRPGVQFMDYLTSGQMIPLHAGERLVIDYLRSCLRETIVGGVVAIGAEKSIVIGGTVSSEKVECDGGKGLLTAEQASKSGVMVFRGAPRKNPATGVTADAPPAASATAPLVLYGASPLVELKSGGELVIERIDRSGERRVVNVASGSRRTLYDCAKEGLALTPGGLYRASSGGRELVFKIDDSAKTGSSPPIGRLLRL